MTVFGDLYVHLELLLGWECAYALTKEEKKGIDGKKAEYKTSNCCNCYLSIVIQCIMGTRSYIFFPCKLEAPTNLILALRRFKNIH